MSAIKGHIDAVKRPGELGVHSMNHFSLAVPDITIAQDFYENFGLLLKTNGNTLEIYSEQSENCWGYITEGPKKKLQYLSFGAFEEDFILLKNRIEKVGVKLLDPPKGVESEGFWFRDLDGTLIQVYKAQKVTPYEKSTFENHSGPSGIQSAPFRSTVKRVRPRRLGHVALFTKDVLKTIDFYQRTLGLRLSDRNGDRVAFMHGIHGSDHHLIAIIKSKGGGLQHLSWDVGSINDIGVGAMYMADKGYQKGWGLGRHVLGSNYFHYIRDPWGGYCEYSADMDFIASSQNWDNGEDHKDEDSFYLWGPEVPQDFVHNYEAE